MRNATEEATKLLRFFIALDPCLSCHSVRLEPTGGQSSPSMKHVVGLMPIECDANCSCKGDSLKAYSLQASCYLQVSMPKRRGGLAVRSLSKHLMIQCQAGIMPKTMPIQGWPPIRDQPVLPFNRPVSCSPDLHATGIPAEIVAFLRV